MISAYFSQNTCVNKKKLLFFSSKLINTKNFNYNANLGIFLLLEVGGFVFKLVAAKVIGQHMFFFILSYFLDNNL